MIAHPQLAAIVDPLGEATGRVRRYLAQNDSAFRRPPAEPRWAAAECLHYRRDVFGWVLAWMIEPPFRTRTKTIAPFEPLATADKAAVIASSKYSLYSALTILTAHQRRHLWRADCALETSGGQ